MYNTHEPENILTVVDDVCSNTKSDDLCMYVPCSHKDGIPNICDIHPMQISQILLNEMK